MSTHTPGPWTAITGGPVKTGHYADWYIITEAEEVVARCLGKTNAALVAAAPDLLAVLKECEAYFRPMAEDGQYLAQQRIDRIRAAIAKAEGVS